MVCGSFAFTGQLYPLKSGRLRTFQTKPKSLMQEEQFLPIEHVLKRGRKRIPLRSRKQRYQDLLELGRS